MAKARIAVLISGRGSNMAALVYAAKQPDCPFEIILVAANDPEAAGLAFAEAENIPTFAQNHKGMKRAEFDAILDGAIRKAKADYVVLAGYMRLLSPEFVGKWEGRMLNIHPSLLPKYKGLDTHERALGAGDTVAGCSVHLVTAELDDGPVLAQTEVAVVAGDTPDSLAARVLIAEHQTYSRALAAYVTRELDPVWLLDQVRQRAMLLPGVEERTSHGSPGFSIVGSKFFALFSQHHHGDERIALLVKTSGAEEQSMLIEQDDDLYYLPPYYAPSGWIGIRLDLGQTDWDHISEWLRKSWLICAPNKLRKTFDVASDF